MMSNTESALQVARTLMAAFAHRTGLPGARTPPVRYLWTDAFAVCTLLELFRRTGKSYRIPKLVNYDGRTSTGTSLAVEAGSAAWRKRPGHAIRQRAVSASANRYRSARLGSCWTTRWNGTVTGSISTISPSGCTLSIAQADSRASPATTDGPSS